MLHVYYGMLKKMALTFETVDKIKSKVGPIKDFK